MTTPPAQTIDASKVTETTCSTLDIIGKVDAFYNGAWTKLLWVIGALAAIIGILLPLYFEHQRKKDFKYEIDKINRDFADKHKHTETALKEACATAVAAKVQSSVDPLYEIVNKLLQSRSLAASLGSFNEYLRTDPGKALEEALAIYDIGTRTIDPRAADTGLRFMMYAIRKCSQESFLLMTQDEATKLLKRVEDVFDMNIENDKQRDEHVQIAKKLIDEVSIREPPPPSELDPTFPTST